jgi:hypothetical protein
VPCLDGLIENELKGLAIDHEKIGKLISEYEEQFIRQVAPAKEKLLSLQSSLKGLEWQKKRSMELYEKELISMSEFAERKKELDEERALLLKEIEHLNEQLEKSNLSNLDTTAVLANLTTFKEFYDQLSHEEQKSLLTALIGRIEVSKALSNTKKKHTKGNEICPLEVTYSLYLAPFLLAVGENCTGRDSSPRRAGSGPGRRSLSWLAQSLRIRFERLAQHLQDVGVKLRQFVEKERNLALYQQLRRSPHRGALLLHKILILPIVLIAKMY